MYKLIVAIDQNKCIGNNNELLFRVKKDLQNFRKITQNNNVIMGSKTFESIGKPLPNRNNIILSKSDKYDDVEGVTVYKSVIDIRNNMPIYKDAFIIGGSTLYNQFYNEVHDYHITIFNATRNGNKYFDELDFDDLFLYYKSPVYTDIDTITGETVEFTFNRYVDSFKMYYGKYRFELPEKVKDECIENRIPFHYIYLHNYLDGYMYNNFTNYEYFCFDMKTQEIKSLALSYHLEKVDNSKELQFYDAPKDKIALNKKYKSHFNKLINEYIKMNNMDKNSDIILLDYRFIRFMDIRKELV